MKIIRIDKCFIYINILGLTLNIPLAGAEQRYKRCWFFGVFDTPFISKMLIFEFFKNFTFNFYFLNKKIELYILKKKD